MHQIPVTTDPTLTNSKENIDMNTFTEKKTKEEKDESYQETAIVMDDQYCEDDTMDESLPPTPDNMNV